jgi:PAS domain S-box-containing protein
VSWNGGAERIFGYTESEAVGQPITILIPPELWDEENQILERLRAGGCIEHYETTRITKNRKETCCLSDNFPD